VARMAAGVRIEAKLIARTGRQAALSSVSDFFQANDDAGRFGLMRGQFSTVRIAPIRETYDLSFLSFHPRDLEQLQYIQPPGVEKEGMLPEQLAKLRNCWMILSKHLRLKLR